MRYQSGLDDTNALFSVSVNGKKLANDKAAYLQTAYITDDARGLSMAEIKVGIWNTENNEFINVDDKDFALGNEIELFMGFGSKTASMIKGEIVSHIADFSSSKHHSLTVRVYDKGHRLTQGKKVRNFIELKDSEIVEKIIRTAGLNPSVEDTGTIIPQVIQNNMTDMEFIRTRASRYGYRIFTEGDKCHFVKEDFNSPSIATLTFGIDFVEFRPTLSLSQPITDVEVRGWDSVNKQSLKGTAARGSEMSRMGGKQTGSQKSGSLFGDQKVTVTNINVYNSAQSKAYADSVLNEHSRNLINARLILSGNNTFKAGTVITLAGLSDSFNGDYYINSSTHKIAAGNYTTILELQRSAS